jgi:iron complex transport system substrate-binding protein
MHMNGSLTGFGSPRGRLPKERVVAPRLLAALLLSLLLLAGSATFAACSSSEPAPSGSEYPLTVTDSLGRSVQLDQKPVRIVTTHPTATETLYRAGGVAIGRDSASKYPAEVSALPAVGGSYTVSAELVAALEPDLIIIEELTQGHLVGQLGQIGAPILAVCAMSLEEIYESLTIVGEVVDTGETAAQAITEIQNRVETAQAALPDSKSVLIFIADAEQKIYAARVDSYPGTVADLLGLDNLAAYLEGPAPYSGFALFSAELAATSDPDVVFTITPAPLPAPRLSAVMSMMGGFKDIPAVKEGRVAELDPVLFLQAQGPRIADAVEELLDIMNSYG